MKFNEYIKEATPFTVPAETGKKEDEGSDNNSQKIMHLANFIDQKENLPKLKRMVKRALDGKVLNDQERGMLKDVLKLMFRPEAGKFRRLLKRF